METINNFNKVQEIEMQNEIENSILNNEIFVKFCKYEYYNTNNKNIKIMKYNLKYTIPIKGNILIVDHMDTIFLEMESLMLLKY